VGIRLRSSQPEVARSTPPTTVTEETKETTAPTWTPQKDPQSWECPECHCVNFLAPAVAGESLCILCGFKGGPGFGCGTIWEDEDDNFGLHYPHSEVSSLWDELPRRRRTSM
jgi:hypothetical protein